MELIKNKFEIISKDKLILVKVLIWINLSLIIYLILSSKYKNILFLNFNKLKIILYITEIWDFNKYLIINNIYLQLFIQISTL